MALLLILDHDNSNADPNKDRRGCYKAGDIVEVLDDSKHDGNLVANPIVAPWYLIRVTGVTADQVKHAMEPELSAVEFDRDGAPAINRRRKYRLNIDDIPVGARTQLLADRYLEVSLAQARTYVRNKTTNENAATAVCSNPIIKPPTAGPLMADI